MICNRIHLEIAPHKAAPYVCSPGTCSKLISECKNECCLYASIWLQQSP